MHKYPDNENNYIFRISLDIPYLFNLQDPITSNNDTKGTTSQGNPKE